MTTTRQAELTPLEMALRLHDIQITADQEALFENLQAWTLDYVDLRYDINQTQKLLETTRQRQPRQPEAYEDLHDWVIHETLVARHQTRIAELDNQLTRLQTRQGAVADNLIRNLPSRIWFKIAGYAVGIQYDENFEDAYPLFAVKWGTHTGINLKKREAVG